MFPLGWLILNVVFPFVAPVLRDCAVPALDPVATYSIPSGSMAPTLPTGSYIASVCVTPAMVVQHGDLIVFRVGPEDGAVFYVKRVIGLPGDRVELSRGVLAINGESATYSRSAQTGTVEHGDPALTGTLTVEQLPGGARYEILQGDGNSPQDTTAPVTVPPETVFVLGDNRENSMDSRFSRIGLVPLSRVSSRAALMVQFKLMSPEILYRWLPLFP